MKISILLPYKENYSPDYPGAVSIFIKSVTSHSKYNKNIRIFGNTDLKNKFSKHYVNIPFNKKILQSSTRTYLKNFLNKENKRKSDIIEIHNRPEYLKYLENNTKAKIVFYFHNDPLLMTGSSSVKERMFILNLCDKIIFNSNWTKEQFLKNIDRFYHNSSKLMVIPQCINKKKVDFNKKEKLITFVGKLNSSKGYDIFCRSVIRILKKHKNWRALVIGDEPREKIEYNHPNLIKLGFKKHDDVLKLLEKTSIAISCSRWEEPFGRSSLEAASRGCASVVSNRGGLVETITDGIILNKLSTNNLFYEIDNLIRRPKKLKELQLKSYKNFYLDNKYVAKIIDDYRESIFNRIILNKNLENLKIIHVTNFNERHNARLFYNTGRRINNGLVRLNNSVVTLSDRDVVSRERKINDVTGSKSLNNKLLEVVGNIKPNLILFGHADQISNDTIIKIKNFYPEIKFGQWFLDKMDNGPWKHNKKRFLMKYDLMDCNFCTTHPASLSFNKNRTFFIPNPVDKTFENLKIFKNKNIKNDLFFAMSHGVHRGVLKKGKTDEREKFLESLISLNPEIKFDFYGYSNIQPIWADTFKEKIKNSKMALNLSQGKSLKFYTSDRIAQLVGNGILTFISKDTYLNKIFKDDEVVFYSGVKDLSIKIRKFKNDEKLRNTIAKKGMEKYHKYMNSEIVCKYMIEKIFNFNFANKYIWE